MINTKHKQFIAYSYKQNVDNYDSYQHSVYIIKATYQNGGYKYF